MSVTTTTTPSFRLGGRVGIVRTDGTRVAGKLVRATDTQVFLTRVVTRNPLTIARADIAEMFRFDRFTR